MALQAFADHCFHPTMTAERAKKLLGSTGARFDFYDLDPLYSRNAISRPNGRPITQGTDRRCEVSFDGDQATQARDAALSGLDVEGIDMPAAVPPNYTKTQVTSLLAARHLNPRRIAVVHTGTRNGANRVETFLSVERLLELDVNP